jgi:predicted nucleic acid-binding protein
MSASLTRSPGRRLLIDTNLLVLLVIGIVNPNRIATFKRTSKYSKQDYDLLVRALSNLTRPPLYTVAHVLAEVSNLTVLSGPERLQARHVLKRTLTSLHEPEMTSVRAAQALEYETLGLVDAAIATVARENGCAVLTDDLDLYLALLKQGIEAFNFSHFQASDWQV